MCVRIGVRVKGRTENQVLKNGGVSDSEMERMDQDEEGSFGERECGELLNDLIQEVREEILIDEESEADVDGESGREDMVGERINLDYIGEDLDVRDLDIGKVDVSDLDLTELEEKRNDDDFIQKHPQDLTIIARLIYENHMHESSRRGAEV